MRVFLALYMEAEKLPYDCKIFIKRFYGVK